MRLERHLKMDKPNMFDAPIGGQGMVAEMGSRPWQQPPQYETVDEALDFYSSKLLSPEFQDQLLDVMELGTPVSVVSNSLQLGGVMQGLHTLDVGILVQPLLMEMIALIGDQNNVKFNMGTEKPEQDPDKFPDSKIAIAVKRATDKIKNKSSDDEQQEVQEVQDVQEEPKGLMARR